MARLSWSELGQTAFAVLALGVAAWLYEQKHSRSSRTPKPVRDVTELIGNTPMVRLNTLSLITGCEIWGKLELSNPGGSAKDRIARAIVEHAEATGKLRPGHRDAVYEGTSGSTGISLALVCRARGYEAHIVVPDDTSVDKISLLERLGAHVHKVRPAGIADRNHYVHVAKRLAEEKDQDSSDCHAIFANQFENEVNWVSHFLTTGPEILAQVPSITSFVTGAGTGGTISGVASFLKPKLPKLRIVLADVPGSGLHNRIQFGVMYSSKEREGHRRRHQVDTIIEGIGLNRVTANLKAGLNHITDSQQIDDDDARYMASFIVENEGLFIGSSSAVNCVAALREARKVGPGHTIVTILCDGGSRHLSKFWAIEPASSCKIAAELETHGLPE